MPISNTKLTLKKELVAKSFGRNESFNASYLTVSNEDIQLIGDTHYIMSTADTQTIGDAQTHMI